MNFSGYLIIIVYCFLMRNQPILFTDIIFIEMIDMPLQVSQMVLLMLIYSSTIIHMRFGLTTITFHANLQHDIVYCL